MASVLEQNVRSNTPKIDHPDAKIRSPASTSKNGGDGGHGSDRDAVADEDMNLGDDEMGEKDYELSPQDERFNGPQPNESAAMTTSEQEESQAMIQARARLRARPKKRARTPKDLESEEDDGMERNPADYDESDGEDEIDSDVETSRGQPRRSRSNPGSAKKQIKTVRDLPIYAQHAYVASTYGLPKLPVPMVLLPGLRSRKPPPIPIPDLTKRSRGRHVSNVEDDGRKYACSVAGCDKRFARGEHLKRHIRSIHTHEKPHQCPYPGCLRGFSRTDNMMQHMRTHDDWPDDETAAKMLAEVEKKTGKHFSPLPKDMQQQLPMMMPPMPWQMHPMFTNWSPQRGASLNLMMPLPSALVEDSQGKGEGTSNHMVGVLPTNGSVLEAQADYEDGSEDAYNSPTDNNAEQNNDKSQTSSPQSPARPTISPAMIMMPNPTASTSNSTTPVKPIAIQSSKTPKKTTAVNSKQGASSARSSPENNKSQPAPVMAAPAPMPGWPMPPGMQGIPYMPMPPLPPGLPFPPPAIAVPIPAGAPLPHPSQLPPNAQLVPNPVGGHTLIIPPPPPHAWGMIPPGMMPMPQLASPLASPSAPQASSNGGNRSSVISESSTSAE